MNQFFTVGGGHLICGDCIFANLAHYLGHNEAQLINTKCKSRRTTGSSSNNLFFEADKRNIQQYFLFFYLPIFILHSRESEFYRCLLDGKSALA